MVSGESWVDFLMVLVVVAIVVPPDQLRLKVQWCHESAGLDHSNLASPKKTPDIRCGQIIKLTRFHSGKMDRNRLNH